MRVPSPTTSTSTSVLFLFTVTVEDVRSSYIGIQGYFCAVRNVEEVFFKSFQESSGIPGK